MSVDKESIMNLLYLDLRDIVTIVKSLDIENMNVDHKQGSIGLTKGRMIHTRIYVPNVTSFDIWAKIVGPEC